MKGCNRIYVRKKILAIIGLVSLAILGVIFISAVAAPEARFEKDVNKLANEYGVGVERVEIKKSTNPSIKNDDVEIYFTNFDLLEMKLFSEQNMMKREEKNETLSVHTLCKS